jgi:CRISP-associated protein Cas1
MMKRTIYLGSPGYLRVRLGQMQIQLPPDEDGVEGAVHSIPVEDIGVLVMDNQQLTFTHGLLQALMENNTAVLVCDSKHHPSGQILPLCSNALQHERYQAQLGASAPLKKQLWAQVVQAKILAQASLLRHFKLGDTEPLIRWAAQVKSGDPTNVEGRAAAYYWGKVLEAHPGCTRDPDGDWPNPAYNYAYAIVRAVVARALVGAGLLPTLGIHHHNRYNAFCLADDMMETLRPIADAAVLIGLQEIKDCEELTRSWKATLLKLPAQDVLIENERSPMMVAAQRMAHSLNKCLAGQSRKLALPVMIPPKLTVPYTSEF